MSANRHRIGIVGGNATRAWAHDAHVPALKKMADRFVIEAVSARTQELADEANAAWRPTSPPAASTARAMLRRVRS